MIMIYIYIYIYLFKYTGAWSITPPTQTCPKQIIHFYASRTRDIHHSCHYTNRIIIIIIIIKFITTLCLMRGLQRPPGVRARHPLRSARCGAQGDSLV